jgi:hypothetical protein
MKRGRVRRLTGDPEGVVGDPGVEADTVAEEAAGVGAEGMVAAEEAGTVPGSFFQH